ncbi:MAG: DNA/RNA non-specific endonuclease, partial [Longimicrobiales bacterium]
VLRRARLAEAEVRPSRVALERLLGTNDLVDVNYLLRAFNAARSVCRIVLRDRAGREIGYGTGFKVAPRILLTNHHVLEDAGDAETAIAEFDFELNEVALPRATTRFALDPGSFFLNNLELDFALAAISPVPLFGQGNLNDYGFLRLNQDVGKINQGEFMSIIQHPSGQPKQISLRENRLLDIKEQVLWYQSDTAQGSSGSPVFNDSWQIVALHHSGVPRTNEQGQWLLKNGQPAGPNADDGDIDWLANEGIRASRIVLFVVKNAERSAHTDEFLRAASGELQPTPSLLGPGAATGTPALSGSAPSVEPVMGGARVTLPVTFTISVAGVQTPPSSTAPIAQPTAVVTDAFEKMKVPIIDADYTNRSGYDANFLGIEVALPKVQDESRVARMENGEHVIPYEHFSVVMDKQRRFALFTASNVDANPEKREPEPGQDYTRKGLSGLGKNDIEMWLTDPRIPEQHQLPDRFFTQDNQAFDKGHIVRREDICWGNSYAQVRRANGDSFHTTNCSPQVAEFNRPPGTWGNLEKFILKQAQAEKYCLLAGPLLRDTDRTFVGKDERGEVRIQIPSAYWKIVVARSGDKLQAFAFVLEQDLSNVPLEFAVNAEWISFLESIEALEESIGHIKFPDAVKQADQHGT